MRALLSTAPGGPETLELTESPDPVPAKGQVLVAVKACAINYPDVLIIEGKYQFKPQRPFAPAGEIAGVIEALGETGIAVVDEAYEPFAQQSFMGRLPEFANLVVMRTVSKLGLAGIRLGYMSAAPQLLAQFDKVRPPYNINVLTQAAAEFALEHVDVLNEQARALRAARSELAQALAALPGVTVFPSAANFLLIRVPDADDAYVKLLADKVLIKNVSKMHSVLANCLRVTVSTPEENSVFLAAITASLAA